MTDPSQLTDAQLLALIGPQGAAQPRQAQRQAAPVTMPARPSGPLDLNRMASITAQSESGNRERDARGNLVTSSKGAQGRMQVMPTTNTSPGYGVVPARNGSDEERTRVGRDYLGAMMQTYGNDPAKAWAAYNWGPGNFDRAVARYGDNWFNAAPAETQAYVSQNLRALGMPAPQPAPQPQAEPDLASIPDAELLALATGEAPAAPAATGSGGQADAKLAIMPWLTRKGRPVEASQGMTTDADGRVAFDVETPGIIEYDDGFEIFDPETSAYYPATAREVADYRRRTEGERSERIEVNRRREDPEYQAARADMDAAAATGPGQARAFGQGYSYGFADELDATAQGLSTGARNLLGLNGEDPAYGMDVAAQATRDAERARAAQFAESNPLQSAGFNILGGVLSPGVRGGGNYIAAGQGAGRLGRAGQVGFLGGVTYGTGTSEGSLLERSPDALQSGLVGAGTSVIGQGAVDRLLGSQATRLTRPASQARRLSREGVDLTPGQMVAETPVIGGLLRNLEEGASTVPIAGAMISDARTRSVNTFNRAALNRVLEPLNQPGQPRITMPAGVRAQIARIGNGEVNPQAGYEAVERVQGIVRREYDKALEGIEVRPDTQFYDELAEVMMDSGERMTPQLTEQLTNVLQNRVFRTLEESDSIMTGEAFKRAESELGALAREQRISLDPANRALAGALDDTRGVLRNLIARQRPDRAPRIQAINRAYANLVPIEEAAGSTASQATEGVFSPTTLATAASRSQTRSQRGAGNARMQDLTAPGKGLLNSRLGDSGTATRVGVTGLMSGAAGAGTLVNPGVAIPVIVGVSTVYSRPAQAALNWIYRATDSQNASEGLVELARLAQRDPALVPYYEAAVEHALQLSQTQTPAIQPGLLQPQTPTAAPAMAN